MFKKIKRLFSNKKNNEKSKGLLLFENTSEVIKAEKVLKRMNVNVKVVGPPPEIRKGCDLAIEISIIEAMGILETLKKSKLTPLDFISYHEGEILEPVDIFYIKDFGKYLMVRAANMKITVDKEQLTIVNISGGGCPDVPYIASKLIGRKITDNISPKDIGHTLCGYSLQLAYKKAKEILC